MRIVGDKLSVSLLFVMLFMRDEVFHDSRVQRLPGWFSLQIRNGFIVHPLFTKEGDQVLFVIK
jgi:hypothetical protein